MAKKLVKSWTFQSKSNPDPKNNHQTLLYDDGSTSCDCNGWTRRVAVDGSRSCTHTRSVDSGTADQECIGMKDYRLANVPANLANITERALPPAKRRPNKKKQGAAMQDEPLVRRFDFDDE